MGIHHYRSHWLPALVWAGFILLVSSIPQPLETAPSGISTFLLELKVLGVGGVTLVSFVIHFFLYAVLGFLVGRGMAGSGRVTPTIFLLAQALCTAFGFLDELYQGLIPGRGFEWIDIFANTIGAAFGIFIFARIRLADGVKLKG